jgi:hypothetical protein
MISIKRMVAIEAPKLDLPSDLKDKLAKLLQGAILKNIKDQKQADGSQLKQNSQRYADYKKRKGKTIGGRVLALVFEERRFARPDLWPATWTKNKLTIEPSTAEDTRQISRDVQIRGYVGWFAPSAKAAEAARALIRAWIQKTIRSVGRQKT